MKTILQGAALALFAACALTVSCSQKKQGKPAPEFALQALDGRSISLADLRGKTVLIDFWATWCAPCVRSMPHIQKVHENYRDQGLVVLAISSEPPEEPRKFVKANGYTFTVLTDPGSKVGRAYGVRNIPTTFIVDPEGMVSTRTVGYKPEAELREALAKAGLTK